ncbi:MAG: FMN-binding protein [Pseudomonadaceae bacterium]|nr:FMN-binding protein [Pseudomonadaceae bacterium]
MHKLAGFVVMAAICGALLATTRQWTQPRIDAEARERRLAAYAEVTDRERVPEALEANPYALCPSVSVQRTTTRGYGGDMTVLVAIKTGAISGVRITEHSETPGIGDFIDSNRSDWPNRLRGLRADSLADIDAVAGATITVRAVRQALEVALAEPDCTHRPMMETEA